MAVCLKTEIQEIDLSKANNFGTTVSVIDRALWIGHQILIHYLFLAFAEIKIRILFRSRS